MTDFNAITDILSRHHANVGGKFTTTRVKTAAERRSAIIKLIDDNLRRYNDPTYVVPTKKGKSKAPDRLFEIQGANAVVCIMYNRRRIKLTADGASEVTIPASGVPQLLNDLRDAVEKGLFDDEIKAVAEAMRKRFTKTKTKPLPLTDGQSADLNSQFDDALAQAD